MRKIPIDLSSYWIRFLVIAALLTTYILYRADSVDNLTIIGWVKGFVFVAVSMVIVGSVGLALEKFVKRMSTATSNQWIFGVIIGLILQYYGLLFGIVPVTVGTDLLALSWGVGWLVLVIAGYFDMKYVMRSSDWNFSENLFVILLIIPFLNIIPAGLLAYQRYQTIGLLR